MITSNCSQHASYGTEVEPMPDTQPSLKTRLAPALFGDIIHQMAAQAAISVRVDDTPGWNRLAPAGSFERPFVP